MTHPDHVYDMEDAAKCGECYRLGALCEVHLREECARLREELRLAKMACEAAQEQTAALHNTEGVEMKRLREENERLRKEMAARSLNALQELAATEQRRDEYKRERDEAAAEIDELRATCKELQAALSDARAVIAEACERMEPLMPFILAERKYKAVDKEGR